MSKLAGKTQDGQHHVPRFSEIDGAGIVAILVLSAIFYFVAFQPRMQQRELVSTQRQLLENQAQKAADSATALHTAQDRLAAAQKQIADNPQKLEPVRALNNRLAGITAAATARKLELADIRPGSATSSTHYTAVSISISGSGSFANCVRYLHDLHEKFGDIAVTGVSLLSSTQDASSTSSVVTFRLQLRWYAAARTAVTAAQ